MNIDIYTASAIVIGTLGLGFVGFMLKWAWTHTHKRIDDCTAYMGKSVDELSNQIARKADNAELLRARDAQKDIFEQIRSHDAEDQARHGQILTAVGRMEGKMDALLMRKREG